MLGSILGVIIETIWCVLRYRKIESRKGLIYGPFNPLYGFATMCLSLCINCVTNKGAGNIFIIGVVVASVIEYLCSYYQEKFTGAVSWNYDKFKFNLNGRINLVYSIFWGLLTLVWYNSFMPLIDEFMITIDSHVSLTVFSVIFIAFDCFISLAATVRRKHRRENIEAKTKFEKHLDSVYTDKILDWVYPNSQVVDD